MNRPTAAAPLPGCVMAGRGWLDFARCVENCCCMLHCLFLTTAWLLVQPGRPGLPATGWLAGRASEEAASDVQDGRCASEPSAGDVRASSAEVRAGGAGCRAC